MKFCSKIYSFFRRDVISRLRWGFDFVEEKRLKNELYINIYIYLYIYIYIYIYIYKYIYIHMYNHYQCESLRAA